MRMAYARRLRLMNARNVWVKHAGNLRLVHVGYLGMICVSIMHTRHLRLVDARDTIIMYARYWRLLLCLRPNSGVRDCRLSLLKLLHAQGIMVHFHSKLRAYFCCPLLAEAEPELFLLGRKVHES